MTVVEQLDLFDFGEDAIEEARREERRAKRRRYRKADYRKTMQGVPIPNGTPFVIVPEIAPILKHLVDICAKEVGDWDNESTKMSGISVLGARAALILGKTEASVVRRLHSLLHQRQLFAKASFFDACLMAMDAEHDFRYSEWPSSRADALERVSIEAEFAGKRLSPDKALKKANRLYDKGVRKALKRAVEVRP